MWVEVWGSVGRGVGKCVEVWGEVGEDKRRGLGCVGGRCQVSVGGLKKRWGGTGKCGVGVGSMLGNVGEGVETVGKQ